MTYISLFWKIMFKDLLLTSHPFKYLRTTWKSTFEPLKRNFTTFSLTISIFDVKFLAVKRLFHKGGDKEYKQKSWKNRKIQVWLILCYYILSLCLGSFSFIFHVFLELWHFFWRPWFSFTVKMNGNWKSML